MKISVQIVAVHFMLIAAAVQMIGEGNAADRLDQGAINPLNATYLIEGEAIGLMDGRGELPAAPGSVMKTKTAVQGRPAYGDLDEDGDEDAVLLLTHDPGGSGTFYYVAAAINASGRYRGTNAILLGDRIAPMDIGIRDHAIVVNYVDRRPEAPMSENPTVGQTAVLLLKDSRLVAISPVGARGKVVEGWVMIGHEVRSFKPCDGEDDLWLTGQSPALKGLMSAYHQEMQDPRNYRPLFMVLAGKLVKPPADGFGADYEAAFLATHLVRVAPGSSWKKDLQDIDSANGYMHKITFDTSTLDETGLYGPIGGKRALSYEFCIPNTVVNRTEVERIDRTVTFFKQSPGRIGCGSHEVLCIGSTHQQGFAIILRKLAALTYVKRIDQSFFE